MIVQFYKEAWYIQLSINSLVYIHVVPQDDKMAKKKYTTLSVQWSSTADCSVDQMNVKLLDLHNVLQP